MNLSHIRYFVAVIEAGTVTRAAERLAITQPTLSAALRKLEDELGTSLLDREPRRVRPTPAGLRFLERARAILRECAAAKAEVRDTGHRRRLRLGVLRTVPAAWLVRLVERVRDAHPDLVLELREGSAARLADWLGQGKADLLLTVLDSEPENQVPLWRERFVALVAPGHPWTQRSTVRLADLHDQPAVLREHCEVLPEAGRRFAAQGVRPRIVARTDQDDWAERLVLAGVGLTVAPETLFSPAAVRVPVADLGLARTIGLRWHPERSDAALTAAVADLASAAPSAAA